MSVRSVARAERRRVEDAYKSHLSVCFDCYRQAKGQGGRFCDIGYQLQKYIDLAIEQEALLMGPPQTAYVQDPLF